MAQAPRPDRVADGDELAAAQEAYEQRRWADVCTHLAAADRHGLLDAAHLDRLATAAYLTGALGDAVGAWERAHRAYLHDGAVARAVRCAFWLGLALVGRGEHARGGGWLQRAQRVLAEAGLDCVEQGYVRAPAGLAALDRDPAAVVAETGFSTSPYEPDASAELLSYGVIIENPSRYVTSDVFVHIHLRDAEGRAVDEISGEPADDPEPRRQVVTRLLPGERIGLGADGAPLRRRGDRGNGGGRSREVERGR